MHVEEEVAPHQAVPAAAAHVEARTAGDENADSALVGVEEALEELLPAAVLVKFVEDDRDRRRGQAREADMLGNRAGAGQDHPSVVGVVPVEIRRAQATAGERLPHLPRAADQRHLPSTAKMVGQYPTVYSGFRCHAD